MRQNDPVFFFTLIDFLVQIIFLGFFLYVISATDTNVQSYAKLREHVGVSNIVELTDTLTRMQPADVVSALNMIKEEGGLEEIKESLELSKSLRKDKHGKIGAGKPHCLMDMNGKAIPLAEVNAFEDRIEFGNSPPQLKEVLTSLGYRFEDISSLRLETFKDRFAKVRTLRPDCVYTVTVKEMTRYVEPRDAIQKHFYTRIIKVAH